MGSRVWVAWFWLLGSCGTAHAGLVKGPYLQDLRPDGVVIAFETDTPAAAAVEFGLDASYGQVATSDATGLNHAIRLAGLPPATLFFYRIRLNQEPAGAPGTFLTAPAGRTPFTVLLYGDNRSDPNAHALVISRMLQFPAALAINTGDMVSYGLEEDQWQEFFDIEADLIRTMPLYPTIGNHEIVKHQAPAAYRRLFVPPKGSEAHPTYYSFDLANIHFVVLDGWAETEVSMECFQMIGGFGECFSRAQVAWLQADLTAAATNPDVDAVVVVTHEGPYSSKPGRTGSGHMRALLPMFAESKVALIVSGHDHYYEHGITANGIHYLITGGGGAPLYETAGPDAPVAYPHEVLVSTSVYNFARLAVQGKDLTVTSYEADGTLIEEFAIAPKLPCTTADDCTGTPPGPCEGSWRCGRTNECVWVCAEPPPCAQSEDCFGSREDLCAGAWECIEGRCNWVCTPAVDCTSDQDCEGRAALSRCEGGRFACVDGVCEWACARGSDDLTRPPDRIEPADANPPAPDASGSSRGRGSSCRMGLGSTAAAWWLVGVAVLLVRRGRAARS